MRPLLATLALLVALPVSADYIAGRTHILFGDQWAPIAGGPVTPAGRPVKSAAFDGERFLLAWRDGDVVWIGLYDEGATVPFATASLDVAGTSDPFVSWNGLTFVLVVEGNPTYVAPISRLGVIESLHTVSFRQIVDVAASPFGTVLLSKYGTSLHADVLDVMLLDSSWNVSGRRLIGSIQRSIGGGATYLWDPVIVPFGNIFYAAWRQGRAGRYDEVVGTRILLDGSAPDIRVAMREPNSLMGALLDDKVPFPDDIVIHTYGSVIAVQSMRKFGPGITTAFVDSYGIAQEGPSLPTALVTQVPWWETVRLPNGSIAAAYILDGVLYVKPMISAPPARRRVSRH